ncbi:MAG: FAD-dependent oxidoreductase [Bacteroidota bacterium]
MKRETMLHALTSADKPWDILIIGGGATGLGCAIEAASRGYRTALIEQSDFAKGTSSRSTKLVHGGVRYLQQGNIALVLEALKERGLMLKNAPHLVHNLPFVVPNYDWWEGPFYGIGLKMYDVLAGRAGIGRSKNLSKARTMELIPTINPEGLSGGVIYYDGQFDDARLAVNMATTAAEQGAILVNYVECTGLLISGGEVKGCAARDVETGHEMEIPARVVINATGVFADRIMQMADPELPEMIVPSQGVHIVLDRSFLPGKTAIMVPRTDDGRVLFAIPWMDRVVVGTTDTEVDDIPLEPRPQREEIRFLLEHAARYLTKDPAPEDVLSTFAGLRPLVGTPGAEAGTSSLSRDHTLHVAKTGLVTITGGKWTTYRKMSEDTVSMAATLASLSERPSVTASLAIHGYHQNTEQFGDLGHYGSDAPAIEKLTREREDYSERLHPDRTTRVGEVVWTVRNEMVRTAEDFLSRRTRELLLNAQTSIEMAPRVISIIAEELGRDAAWQKDELSRYESLASGYLIDSYAIESSSHDSPGQTT